MMIPDVQNWPDDRGIGLDEKGTHLSRFIEVLDRHAGEPTPSTIPVILKALQTRLGSPAAQRPPRPAAATPTPVLALAEGQEQPGQPGAQHGGARQVQVGRRLVSGGRHDHGRHRQDKAIWELMYFGHARI
jgi:hypothetical protein